MDLDTRYVIQVFLLLVLSRLWCCFRALDLLFAWTSVFLGEADEFIAGMWARQRSIPKQHVTALRFVDDGNGLLGGTKDGALCVCFLLPLLQRTSLLTVYKQMALPCSKREPPRPGLFPVDVQNVSSYAPRVVSVPEVHPN